MSIITKTIGKGEYAYLVKREGKKVVHKYIGRVSNPKVAKIISDRKETAAVPERFRSLFWDTSLKNIHLRKNARYVIERILEFGDLDAVEWMQRVYTLQAVLDVLTLSKSITEKTRNFWLQWFGVRNA